MHATSMHRTGTHTEALGARGGAEMKQTQPAPLGLLSQRSVVSLSTASEHWAGTWSLSEASLMSWYLVKATHDAYAQGASEGESRPGSLTAMYSGR